MQLITRPEGRGLGERLALLSWAGSGGELRPTVAGAGSAEALTDSPVATKERTTGKKGGKTSQQVAFGFILEKKITEKDQVRPLIPPHTPPKATHTGTIVLLHGEKYHSMTTFSSSPTEHVVPKRLCKHAGNITVQHLL